MTTMLSRRAFLGSAGASVFMAAGAAARGGATPAATSPGASMARLTPITGSAVPIAPAEREARIVKLQAMMTERRVGALLVESGSTLDYFTGIEWRRSERTTAAIIPARGRVLIVTPAFEEPSVREMLPVAADVRPWDEPDNPFAALVQGLKDRGLARGVLAVEPTLRFFIIDGLRRVSDAYTVVSGDSLVRACRLIKSPAELALMQAANDVTLAALRWVHSQTVEGMSDADLGTLMDQATSALGGTPEFSLVLLNEASAYPHGSRQPQAVREGSIILMDCGCTVHGYQSDISRTWVHGKPGARQRQLWNTVRRGQEIALETARLGVPVGAIDDAVRRYYEAEGWGPGYRLPGLPHRTGHGIGLDGHEAPYLVHGDGTPLEAGMCFSDEPGLYVPGEFGVRLEDCWHMTAAGPQTFSRLATSLEDPI
jgi:Xaa-Pro dipeptidase